MTTDTEIKSMEAIERQIDKRFNLLCIFLRKKQDEFSDLLYREGMNKAARSSLKEEIENILTEIDMLEMLGDFYKTIK